MRLGRKRRQGALLFLLIALTVLLVLPPRAGLAADEPPAAPAPVKVEDPPAKPADAAALTEAEAEAEAAGEADGGTDEESGSALSANALEQRLTDNPSAFLAILLSRFLPILIGLVLLVLWYLKRDKIKGGLIAPPPAAEPTLLFPPGLAYLVAIGGMWVIPALVGGLLGQMAGVAVGELPLWQKMLAGALGSVPTALLILYRRRLVARLSAPQREALLGPGAPAPTQPPGLGRAFMKGLWLFCVAAVILTPLALMWALVLHGFGETPKAQELVTRVVESASSSEPWVIFVFGVLIAPFVEECVFRGLLYPATKRAFGGGRAAAWKAAILVSLIFAGIHGNWLALVPLFALAMLLTWILETTNSLAAAVVAHATHNALSLAPLLVLRYAT